jgi:HK97 family phage prohead protease
MPKPISKSIERRSLGTQTREGNKITIRLPFSSWSEDLGGFIEQISPQAFDRTLTNPASEVLALWNHNDDKPIGRRSNGSLALDSDEDELVAEISPDETSWSDDARASVQAGTVRGSSFAFIARDDEWDRTGGIWKRTLLDVDLLEISPTPWPAYPDSSATVEA